MQLPKGVRRRGNVLWIWTRVPAQVKSAYGREFVHEAIDESDVHTAVGKAHRRLSELHSEWDVIRNRGKLTPHKSAEMVADFRAESLRYEQMMAATLPPKQLKASVEATLAELSDDPADAFHPATIELMMIAGASDYEQDRREKLDKALRLHLQRGETMQVEWAADDLIARHELDVPKASQAYRQFCGALTLAWSEALREQPAPGESRPERSADTPTPVTLPRGQRTPGQSIMERFEAYAKANPKAITADSINIYRQCIRTFADFLPDGFDAAKITKREVREWQDALRLMPIKASESREFKGKKLIEIIKVNETVGKPVLSKASINKHLNCLSAFCDWLVRRDELSRNPVDGLRDVLDKKANSPEPFTSDELRKLFSSPLFTGFESDGREHLRGISKANDWRYWLPLMALYTGARLSEIAQLLIGDIRQEGEHWCFHITDAGGHGKTLKTASSRRIIPVHSDLVKLGFREQVEKMQAKGATRLFPDLTPDARGQLGGRPSKWFGRYFRRVGVKDNKSRNFHGLRHGFADALRRAGYLDAQIGIILGHVASSGAMTRGYGIIPQGEIALRVEMMSKVSFPEIAHLII